MEAMNNVQVFDGALELAVAAARRIEAWAHEDVAEHGRCRVALAGGSTPLALYRYWAEHTTLAPNALELWYGDERCVPLDHEDSNHRAAHQTLIAPLCIDDELVHPIDVESGGDFDAVAARYAASLPERFDVVLLGMGPDGHTASLFPGDRAALDERERGAIHVVGPKPPPDRITLTRPVLDAARRLVVLAAGEGKAPAVAAALDPTTDLIDCPVALAREREWMLDRAAASALDR